VRAGDADLRRGSTKAGIGNAQSGGGLAQIDFEQFD
jgi:hypothetical protein